MNRADILQEAAAVGFDGDTYSHSLDGARLTGLMGRVFDLVQDGNWYSLALLSALTGGSESSVAARLRDLRKERFGAFDIERKREAGGVHFYRMRGRKVTPAVVQQLSIDPAKLFEFQHLPAFDEAPGRIRKIANPAAHPDLCLNIAVAALKRIAAGEGSPRPQAMVAFPKWAQMQRLAQETLQTIGAK